MSGCQRQRLVELVEGRLGADGAAVERHAGECAACGRALARLRAARSALAAARVAAPPEVDFGRVQARMRAELDEPLHPARAWFRRPLPLVAFGAAAALAVVVGVRATRPPTAPVAVTAPAAPTGPAATRLQALPILVQGDVREIPRDEPVSPTRPLDAGAGARVAGGRLVLQLEAGTALVVAPRSEVGLGRLDTRRIDVRLGSGAVYAQVAPRRPGQEFVIATAGHTVAVRGTRYSVERLAAATRVAVLEGTVEVHTVGTGWDHLGARVPAGTVMLFPDGANPARLVGTGMTAEERTRFEAAARAPLLAGFVDARSALGASGLLEVGATPLPGEVTVDREPVGSTPLALLAPRGRHTVELARAGYQRELRTVELTAEPRRVALRLLQTGEENARAAELARHARVHQHELKTCYDRALRRAPGLEGVVKLRLTLAADGRISGARALPGSGLPATVEACLTKTVTRWRLGPGAPVTVDYPVVLKPELSFETP